MFVSRIGLAFLLNEESNRKACNGYFLFCHPNSNPSDCNGVNNTQRPSPNQQHSGFPSHSLILETYERFHHLNGP